MSLKLIISELITQRAVAMPWDKIDDKGEPELTVIKLNETLSVERKKCA